MQFKHHNLREVVSLFYDLENEGGKEGDRSYEHALRRMNMNKQKKQPRDLGWYNGGR